MERSGSRGVPVFSVPVRLSGLLALAAVTCGCTTVGLPNRTELEAVEIHEKALVLVRFNSTKDGKPIGGIDGSPAHNYWFDAKLVNVDLGYPGVGAGKRRSLTTASRDEGWIFFVLSPGTYCLYVDSPWTNRGEVPYRLEVSVNQGLIYAGTVNVPVVMKTGPLGLKIFGGFDEPGITLSNEADLARALAAQTLPDLGPPVVMLMPRFDEAMNRRTDLSNLRIQAYRPADFVTASDMHKAMEDSEGGDVGLAIAAGGLDMAGSAASSGSTDWAAGGGIVVAGAVIAAGLLISGIGALFDAAEKSEWEQHFREVSAEVVAYDPAGKLQEQLARRLGGRVDLARPGPSDSFVLVPHGTDPVLQVWVQDLDFLAGPDRDELCLRAAFRARLWDPGQDRWAYDRILVYTNPAAHALVPPYATTLDVESTIHDRESFRSPDGRVVIREELTVATNAAAIHIARDLTGAPGQSPGG